MAEADVGKETVGVWKYFQEENKKEKFAKCTICSKNISAQYGNTSNLRKHLMGKHKIPVAELDISKRQKRKPNEQDEGPGTSGAGKQLRLSQFLHSVNKWEANDARKKTCDEKLAKMVARDYQPLRIVEDTGFRDFVHNLQPEYPIPSRKTLRWSLIPNLYTEVEKSVVSKLNKAESVAITTDHWSSRTTEAYIAVTAHFLTDAFENNDVCLNVSFTPERHTAENIANDLRNVVNKWIPDNEKMKIYVVRDNASNIVAACNLLPSNFKSFGCFNHTLQLVLGDSIKEFKGVQNVIAKCRTIVNHFRHSTKSTASLKEMQQKLDAPKHKLKTFSETRWNSTYHLMQRIVEQKAPLSTVLATVDINNLTTHEWRTAEDYVNALAPFEDATVIMSATRYSTLSMVIPVLNNLVKQMDSIEMNDFGKSVKRNINKRWPNYEHYNLLLVATVLDPRFKLYAFSDSFTDDSKAMETVTGDLDLSKLPNRVCDKAKQILIDLMMDEYNAKLKVKDNVPPVSILSKSQTTKDVHSEGNVCLSSDKVSQVAGPSQTQRSLSTETSLVEAVHSTPSKPVPDSSTKKKSDFWQRYKQRVSLQVSKSSLSEDKSKVKASFEFEIERYNAENPLDVSESPFPWWAANSTKFPNLALLAKKYLCIPSTSVPSERIFSKAGLIISERRSRLEPDFAEQLVFLNQNLNSV